MRTASLLIGVLLAGCAGQEPVSPSADPVHEPAPRSHALATLGAYAHDRDPRELLQPRHWPSGRSLDRAASTMRSCAGQPGHYQLIARLSPFEHAEGKLPGAVRGELAALAQALLRQPFGPSVLVAGHTDSAGSAAYNQRLSERRAQAVARELERQGLPRTRLQTLGFGEHAPMHPLLVSDVAPLNRRVEIFSYLPLQSSREASAPCLQAVQRIGALPTAVPTSAEVTK
ncbi:OmpA family protein [Pseudomonas benzenivorans]|uniref:OmpA family protein n=1 Tax=Pseudomonas benzenivorans TaxID=556533 RepID=A0ABY5H827_9PSED|nr:OmpA family protein [Pseudomonas benzenivorans]UTW08472.1 OmpA family protein [Pseudomonas benzenivorans]